MALVVVSQWGFQDHRYLAQTGVVDQAGEEIASYLTLTDVGVAVAARVEGLLRVVEM